MNRFLVAVALSFVSLRCVGAPAECDLKQFPAHWSDAESRVTWLNSFLEAEERKRAYASASSQAFRQALGVCRAKREAANIDPRGPSNAGVTAQMRCEALLICARIAAMELAD